MNALKITRNPSRLKASPPRNSNYSSLSFPSQFYRVRESRDKYHRHGESANTRIETARNGFPITLAT